MNFFNPTNTNTMLVSLILFFPILGALFVLFLPDDNKDKKLIHKVSAVITAINLIFSIILAWSFDISNKMGVSFQFQDIISWIPGLNINYHVGVDGLSLPMVVLTTLIMFISTLASWGIENRPKLYFFLFLILETGILGVFCSLDLFLFFVMWELELIPMYFLIGIWGGPRREYAAMKFILYTAFGSALMLITFIAIYFISDSKTFDLVTLLQQSSRPFNEAVFSKFVRGCAFFSLFICFNIKLPMVPFHTWLPDAHVEAPTPISVILAGVLLKMGAYGIIRFCFGLFPDLAREWSLLIGILGVINIVYGAFLALAQDDMKRVIAYSSISHMGFVLLGLSSLTTIGINGGIVQMFSHGVITALLFLFVGIVYDRTHTRSIKELGGLAQNMPLTATLFVFSALAAVGVPGLSGFVSEFLVFLGTYQTQPTLAIFAASSVIISAIYMLWLGERVFFGPLPDRWKNIGDLNGIEAFNMVSLSLIVIIIGVYPAVIMDIINPVSKLLISSLGLGG